MHLTILALGSYGDVLPYAVLGGGLAAAGHQVRFLTFKAFEPLITSRGMDFSPIQGDPQALVKSAGADMLALVRSFGSLTRGYTNDLSTVQFADTDLLLNQLPLGLFGNDLAEKYGVPTVGVAVMPLTPTRDFPVHGFPSAFTSIPGYNLLTYRIPGQLVWQMFLPALNAWRRNSLRLPRLTGSGYPAPPGKTRPFLYGFSSRIVPRPADWEASVHITGYWLPEDNQWQPPDDLCSFIEAGEPPIFIGFGSMPVRDPERLTRLVLQAVEKSGQRLILHSGWSGLGLRALPETIFKIDYAPYGWLFPRLAAIVHHGGSGTTGFAVRSGIPSVVVPFVFDQFFWGRRLAALGVAPQPVPFKRLSADRLASAIQAAVSDPGLRRQAALLGQKIRQEDGIARAIQIIEDRA